MFKVAFFVDDAKLARALRNLTGVSRGAPEVIPIVNVEGEEAAEGMHGPPPKAAGNGSLTDLTLRYLAHHKPTEIAIKYVQDFLVSQGKSRGSATYVVSKLIEAGALKKHGKGTGTRYRVNHDVLKGE